MTWEGLFEQRREATASGRRNCCDQATTRAAMALPETLSSPLRSSGFTIHFPVGFRRTMPVLRFARFATIQLTAQRSCYFWSKSVFRLSPVRPGHQHPVPRSMSCNSECPTQPCGFADTELQDSNCRNCKKRIVYEDSADGPLPSNHYPCSRSPAILPCVEILQRAR
jgi:hypothetical protein